MARAGIRSLEVDLGGKQDESEAVALGSGFHRPLCASRAPVPYRQHRDEHEIRARLDSERNSWGCELHSCRQSARQSFLSAAQPVMALASGGLVDGATFRCRRSEAAWAPAKLDK
ncbi:hypothetical protein ANO11243_056020 [Dothideomycetidae sp. 11243]|nr:hypothetical protein ANO11243_056020 [fungal sp. No.11243]